MTFTTNPQPRFLEFSLSIIYFLVILIELQIGRNILVLLIRNGNNYQHICMSIQELLRLERNINGTTNHLEEIDIEISLVTEYYQQQLNVFTELLSYIWIYPDTKEGVRGLITYRESKLPLDILYLIKQEIKEELKCLHNHLFNLQKDRNDLLFIRRNLLTLLKGI